MKEVYKCIACNWEGDLESVEWDKVETCMGLDAVAICPLCGNPLRCIEK